MIEPSQLIRADIRRPGWLTVVPWKSGLQVFCNVTPADLLEPFCIESGSLANHGTAAAEPDKIKETKYRKLAAKSYLFQPLAIELQELPGLVGQFAISWLLLLLSFHHDFSPRDYYYKRYRATKLIIMTYCTLSELLLRNFCFTSGYWLTLLVQFIIRVPELYCDAFVFFVNNNLNPFDKII